MGMPLDLSTATQPIIDEWIASRADGRTTIREVITLLWVVIKTCCFSIAPRAIAGAVKKAIVMAEIVRIVELIWPQVAACSWVIRAVQWMPRVDLKAAVILAADALVDLIYADAVKPQLGYHDDTVPAIQEPPL